MGNGSAVSVGSGVGEAGSKYPKSAVAVACATSVGRSVSVGAGINSVGAGKVYVGGMAIVGLAVGK